MFSNNLYNQQFYNTFNYILVIIVFIAISSKLTIGLNVVAGVSCAIYIIYYMQTENMQIINDTNNLHNLKTELLRPESKIIDKYTLFADFIFSIQEFYGFAPLIFEDIVYNIEELLILYENSVINPKMAGTYYTIAIKKQSDILNAVHNLIYSCDVAEKQYYITKINDAVEQISLMTDAYIDKIYTINSDYIKQNGLNIYSQQPENHKLPKPENYYFELDKKLSNYTTLNLY